MSYFPKPSLNENDLAIIERGDTAAHSIEAGQYVSWHGKTGKAKAAILQGATLDDTLFDYDEDGVLNVSFEWKHYTTLSGTNQSALPSDYVELLFVITYKNAADRDTVVINKATVEEIGTGTGYITRGGVAQRYFSLRISNRSVCIYQAYFDGAEYKENSKLTIYYR